MLKQKIILLSFIIFFKGIDIELKRAFINKSISAEVLSSSDIVKAAHRLQCKINRYRELEQKLNHLFSLLDNQPL